MTNQLFKVPTREPREVVKQERVCSATNSFCIKRSEFLEGLSQSLSWAGVSVQFGY